MSDRIGVMRDGRLLQVAVPEELYERPATRFVADFIGRSNILPGTVGASGSVVLTNGDRLELSATHAPGTTVGVAVRPERVRIDQPGTVTGRHHLDGKVARVTYVGNAVVYAVNVDWIELEVRASNDAPHDRHEVGDPVTVSFASEHATVVEDDV